jgi:gliding motility-associated lipoprotein GldH
MKIFILVIAVSILFFSCNEKAIFVENHKIEGGWHKDDIQEFEVNAESSEQLYNAMIKLIISDDYPYSNIWFFTKIMHEGEVVDQDTIMMLLCDQEGHWFGHHSNNKILQYWPFKQYNKFGGKIGAEQDPSSGKIKKTIVWDNDKIHYGTLNNIQFLEDGKYTFTIQHAMRDDVISGIHEVGLKLYETKTLEEYEEYIEEANKQQ